MDLINYLSILRRRWTLVVGAIVLTLLVVWVTLPSKPTTTPAARSYIATATMVVNPLLETPPNLDALAVFLGAGDVPVAAAKKVDFAGTPQDLASELEVAVNTDAGYMEIAKEGSDGPRTAAIVNAFADELITFLDEHQRDQAQNQIERLTRRIDVLNGQQEELANAQQLNPRDASLTGKVAGLNAAIEEANTALVAAQGGLTKPQPLTLLQEAVPIAESGGGFTAPSSARSRVLIGGGLGLMLGIALALLVERVDSRLRTRDEAEAAFQLPVLAEIPALPWHFKHSLSVLSAMEPGSATAESYRSLRSAVLLLRPSPSHSHRSEHHHFTHDPAVIMVTSARAGEGKTTTVANLAVVMAESGRRVLVLSLDFRNPKIHEFLNIPSGSGLSDLLSAGRPQDLELIVRESQFAGVAVATAGQEMTHPGALLAGVGPLIEAARNLADVVLIDTAPLLSVSDAVDLSPHVDAALVVSRANRTTSQQAASSQRLLSRLGVPALGAVLVGVGGSGHDSYVPRPNLVEQIATRLGNPGRRQGDDPDSTGPGQHTRTKGPNRDD